MTTAPTWAEPDDPKEAPVAITDLPALASGFDDIDATIAGLIDLAVWRTNHPEIAVVLCSVQAVAIAADRSPAQMVRAIKDGAQLGSITKDVSSGDGDDRMHIKRSFPGDVSLAFVAKRDEVCERRVTGTETVEVPDPEAPLVTVERETFEWVCSPILDEVA